MVNAEGQHGGLKEGGAPVSSCPGNRETIPRNRETIPGNWETIPGNWETIPGNWETIPGKLFGIPGQASVNSQAYLVHPEQRETLYRDVTNEIIICSSANGLSICKSIQDVQCEPVFCRHLDDLDPLTTECDTEKECNFIYCNVSAN